jgi:hypothetical protein
VGAIPFNPKLDTTEFVICNEQNIKQYYVRRGKDTPAQFKGEKFALDKQILGQYSYPIDSSQNGFVTIRFIVNCKGQSGRFRILVTDYDLKKSQLNTDLTGHLLSICKSLKGWVPVQSRGKSRDFYKFLTFRIKNGQITEILP